MRGKSGQGENNVPLQVSRNSNDVNKYRLQIDASLTATSQSIAHLHKLDS